MENMSHGAILVQKWSQMMFVTMIGLNNQHITYNHLWFINFAKQQQRDNYGIKNNMAT